MDTLTLKRNRENNMFKTVVIKVVEVSVYLAGAGLFAYALAGGIG